MIEMKKVVSEQDLVEVATLAREIWIAHYVPIIGQAQVDYMLKKFQSFAVITQQLKEGYEYYLAGSSGYLAVVSDAAASSLMISKIYVKSDLRGQGIGRRILDFAESLCRERKLTAIWLTVNKHNAASIAWYERMGFVNAGALVQDIGGGFVMDDFKMVKTII